MLGKLVKWKPDPESIGLVVRDEVVRQDRYSGIDILFGKIPEKLEPVSVGNIVQGFGAWELEVISESR